MSTTIYDVASQAGVSAATVSRVLNGSRLIGETARRKVLEAAREVGYARRRVRRQRERAILTVKLVLPRHASGLKRLFYDFSELADGLREGLAPCEVNLLTDVTRRGFDPFPHKKGGDLDAFVFAFQRPSDRVVREVRERGAELIVINRTPRGVPHVTCDNRAGMRQLAAHLRARGVSDGVVFLAYEGIADIRRERLEGFMAASRELGISFDEQRDVMDLPAPEELRATHLRGLLRRGASTFVCVNDVLAALVVQGLHELGVGIPSEARVTGFDDSPVRGLIRPSLTTVRMPVAQLGRAAGRALQAVLVDQEEMPPAVRLTGSLLAGETT